MFLQGVSPSPTEVAGNKSAFKITPNIILTDKDFETKIKDNLIPFLIIPITSMKYSYLPINSFFQN